MYVLHYDKDFEIIWYTQSEVDLLIYGGCPKFFLLETAILSQKKLL